VVSVGREAFVKRSVRSGVGALAAICAVWLLCSGAQSADLGGSCCADLEERVAELEATTARKGNRMVSLEISGQLNEALLFWDDSTQRNVFQTTNMVSQSRFRFVGDAKINGEWSAGYLLEIGINGARSDGVYQPTDDGISPNALSVRHSAWWVGSRSLGRVWVGQTSQAADGITEINLANTGHFATENAAGQAGALYVRGAGGVPTTTRLGVFMGGPNDGGDATTDAAQIGEGNRRNLVKYETPTWAGFTASASWGEDDFWDVALRYAGEFSGFKVAFGIGYEESTEGVSRNASERNCAIPLGKPTDPPYDVKCQQLGLSGAVMHVPTGLFVHGAYGIRWDDNAEVLWGKNADDQSTQLYLQAGIEKNWLGIGKTTLFGEYQRWDVGATNKWFATDMRMWGVGLNQSIAAAAMDLYIDYRHYYDLQGFSTFGGSWTSFQDVKTVMAGGIIRF